LDSNFSFIKRDDFAIFDEDGYIPDLLSDYLEMIAKYPEKHRIKTFDIEGVKLDIFNSYRIFLNQSTDVKLNNVSFIETIKPFIVFTKGLKSTRRTQND